jgi:NMD protein affecting ribosome stability and mRNA decay
MQQHKLTEPAICQQCKAVYKGGRWTWKTVENTPVSTHCPACLRIAQSYPAGILELQGTFFNEHKSQIMNLVENVAESEKRARPLERVMKIRKTADTTIIETTGVHIARRIGEALARAYKGNYSFRYPDGENSIRVSWER